MRFRLVPHADCPRDEFAVEAEVSRLNARTLRLRYAVVGCVDHLLLPPETAPDRADGLWQHTCFEAFLRNAKEDGYRELNFSPSTQWAAYAFTGYREGMARLDVSPPQIETRLRSDRFELDASVDVPDTSLHLALSAVIEEASGRKSYWALAHPPGKPDFHHHDCFTIEFPSISSPRT